MTNFEKVQEFHSVYGVPAPKVPQRLTSDRMQLRRNLISEEVQEWGDALAADDFREQVDALIDTLYVVYGTLIEMGVNADAAFAEVHRSNMSKLGADGKPVYRESDNKVLKGPNFSLPDLTPFIGAELDTRVSHVHMEGSHNDR